MENLVKVKPHTKITYDFSGQGKFTHQTHEEWISVFRDGRNSKPFEQALCVMLGGILPRKESGGLDGNASADIIFSDGKSMSVKVISLSGVKFQKSKFVGSGRKCSNIDLLSSIRCTDYHALIDIRSFPLVDFYIMDRSYLEDMVRVGKLTPSGWAGSSKTTPRVDKELEKYGFNTIVQR